MRLVWNAFLIVTALGLTVGAGVLHGRYSNRWGGATALSVAAERLVGVQETFGDWQLQEKLPLPQLVIDELKCAGYLNHRYANTQTGEVVTIAVLVGPPGPISVHTPEICYSSREFELAGERRKETVDRQEFWAVDMRSRRVDGTPLGVCYSWTTDGRWQAAEEPRFAFAGQPLLFKIQVAAAILPAGDAEQRNTCLEFLEAFIPELNRQLFGDGPAAQL